MPPSLALRHDHGMNAQTLLLCLGICGLAPALTLAQPVNAAAPTSPATVEQTAPAPEAAAVDPAPESALPAQGAASQWSWGLGALHYREPGLMQLSGPQAGGQWRYRPSQDGWPSRLQLDAEVGGLRYTSSETGQLNGVLSLGGRASSLWPLHESGPSTWHAGLQIDLLWTDLRGTSSTGHLGYRRLGSKLWAVLQYEPDASGSQWQIGALLRGRQDSLLSDMGGRDITNTQRQGVFVAYQHRPLPGVWGARPWLRYADVQRSDLDGRYYEPHNRQWQLGLLFDF